MNRLLITLVIFALAACASRPAPEPPLRQQGQATMKAAAQASAGSDWRLAVRLWQEAARQQRALDDWRAAGQASLGQAQALHNLQQAETAKTLLDEILTTSLYPAAIRAEAGYQLALLYVAQGDSVAAKAGLDQAASSAEPALLAAIDNLRGRIALAEGDATSAGRFASRALANGAIAPAERANALRLQGRAALLQRDHALARQSLEAALALDRQLARPAGIAADWYWLAALARQTGEPAADAITERAAAICNAAAACQP